MSTAIIVFEGRNFFKEDMPWSKDQLSDKSTLEALYLVSYVWTSPLCEGAHQLFDHDYLRLDCQYSSNNYKIKFKMDFGKGSEYE